MTDWQVAQMPSAALQVQGKEVFILHFTYGSDYDERVR